MALVAVTQVEVGNNPAPFLTPLQFTISFESLQDLADDLEWKLIYVGSADSEAYDQELDSVLVGPVNQGAMKFVFTADPPDPSKIPESELMGVTVILLTCSYRNQEFIRVGYYVNIEYDDPELQNAENQPAHPDPKRLVRNILDSKPRVTRFPINWDGNPADLAMPSAAEAAELQEEAARYDAYGYDAAAAAEGEDDEDVDVADEDDDDAAMDIEVDHAMIVE